MAIRIESFDEGVFKGSIEPEYIPPSLEKELTIERQINSVTDGYSPDKSLRKIGSIPQEFLYNYAMLKGIKPSKQGEFWAADNGKNLIKVLEEFKSFKVVDKPI